ncbi:MAG: DUF2207 domain-containing protein [Fimbriimonadaceae bacterium]
MKRVLCALLLFLSCLALGQDYGYQIDTYDVAMDLRADGTMSVRETLDVTFNDSRRGIFRMLPIDLDSGRGTSRSIMVDNISVVDPSGQQYTTQISREGIYLKIRIGDAKIFLPPGTRKTYVISYTTFGMLNWFGDDSTWEPYVELYWNVIGPEWDTSIGRTTFTIKTPRVDPTRIRAQGFIGGYGSREKAVLGETGQNSELSLSFRDNTLIGDLNRKLSAYEGLSIVLDLPEELVSRPTFLQAAVYFLKRNIGFLIPLFVLLGAIPIWFLMGRDPAGGPMVVQFEPPDGLTGPEVGTLIDERVDQRDLAAGLIGLAVRGYLEIFPQEEGLIFKRRTAQLQLTPKPAGPEMTVFEKSLYDKLSMASSGGAEKITETDLRTYVAPGIGELRESLYQSLVDHGYYIANPNTVRIAWLVSGLAMVAILGYLCYLISPTREIVPSVVGGVFGAVLVFLFSRGMPKRTHKGAKARMLVIGFEEFIKRARGDELEWITKKQPDQALFESYLPHAVAFGLTKEWAEAFRNIELEMPTWYHGPMGMWNPIWFASDLGSVTDSVASSAMTPPRSSGASGGSSGFSGGGFSGGGFGGGGGGSW